MLFPNCNIKLTPWLITEIFIREPNENNEDEFDKSVLVAFLEEIKVDYENYGPQFRIALDKFAKRYHASKSKSISRLCSFLYDINRNVGQKWFNDSRSGRVCQTAY